MLIRGSVGEGIWIVRLARGNYCKNYEGRVAVNSEMLTSWRQATATRPGCLARPTFINPTRLACGGAHLVSNARAR